MKRYPRLDNEERNDPRRAAQALLRHHAARLAMFEPVAREGTDHEGVHQMRVETRRLRGILRMFKDVLPKGSSDALRERLSALGDALGRERDADVMNELLDRLAETYLEPSFEAVLGRRRELCSAAKEQAHETLLHYLDSPEHSALLAALFAASGARRPGKAPRAQRFAAKAVKKLLERVSNRALAAKDHAPEPVHALRRAIKNLRYGLEALRDVLAKRARNVAKRAQRLQDKLGDVHDIDVALSFIEARALRLRLFRERKLKLSELEAEVAALCEKCETLTSVRTRTPRVR